MKSIFLYEDVNQKIQNIGSPGIYRFGCCNLVGIDTKKLNKRERVNFVKKSNLREVHILQRWFAELIYYAQSIGIIITNIELTNINEKTEEGNIIYSELSKYLTERNNQKLLQYLIELNKEYESEIKSLSFVYDGVECKITSTGILEAFSAEDDIRNCLANSLLWSVLIGQSKMYVSRSSE